jgi:hypothetical protein
MMYFKPWQKKKKSLRPSWAAYQDPISKKKKTKQSQSQIKSKQQAITTHLKVIFFLLISFHHWSIYSSHPTEQVEKEIGHTLWLVKYGMFLADMII